jgi:hypothetical protein
VFGGTLGAPLPGSAGIQIDGSNAQIQLGNVRIDAVAGSAIRVGGQGNRIDVFALRCQRYNLANTGAAAVHVEHAVSGTPNQVHLGTPPILGAGNGGPLGNAGTNGLLQQAVMAPAGTVNAALVGGAASGAAPGIAATGADADVSLALAAKGAGVIAAGAPVQLPSYAVAALPPAAACPRCVVHVADGAGGRSLAVSDGTAWRWPDGTPVS